MTKLEDSWFASFVGPRVFDNLTLNDGFVMYNSPVVKLTESVVFICILFSFRNFNIFNVVQKSLSGVTYMIIFLIKVNYRYIPSIGFGLVASISRIFSIFLILSGFFCLFLQLFRSVIRIFIGINRVRDICFCFGLRQRCLDFIGLD